MEYQLVIIDGQTSSEVVKKIDGDKISFVPNDPANIDWQEYQEWLAQGNEPEPADEQP